MAAAEDGAADTVIQPLRELPPVAEEAERKAGRALSQGPRVLQAESS